MSNPNIVKARVKVKGSRAFLFHRFGPDAIPLEKQERTGVAGNDPEEWKRTVSYDQKTRRLFVPSTYAFATIREGARHLKAKGSQKNVASTLQVLEERIEFDRTLPAEDEIDNDSSKPVYVDIASVRNPSTKGRNVRYRVAMAPGWETEFTVLFDKTIVSRAEIETACRYAGQLSGLGDGRSVGYGRFEVMDFQEIE